MVFFHAGFIVMNAISFQEKSKGVLCMKLENQILEKVVCGNDFIVAGGESVVSSKLSKVIAGVPVYSLTIQQNVDFAPDITADTFEELLQKGDEYLRICPECNGIAEMGYFIDQEDDLKLCSVECVHNHLKLSPELGVYLNAICAKL